MMVHDGVPAGDHDHIIQVGDRGPIVQVLDGVAPANGVNHVRIGVIAPVGGIIRAFTQISTVRAIAGVHAVDSSAPPDSLMSGAA